MYAVPYTYKLCSFHVCVGLARIAPIIYLHESLHGLYARETISLHVHVPESELKTTGGHALAIFHAFL